MLHTIVSENDIFAPQNAAQAPNYAQIPGGMVEYRRTEGINTVVRLHSTNPFLYLDGRYAPFTELK